MKNRIKCPGCGKGLNADGMQPRSVAACPNCGNSVTVPFPGMGAGKFAALYFGSWFAIIILVAMLGQVAAIAYLVWLGFKLWLGYQRAINIGWRPSACLWVLLPFLGALVLACHKTGEGSKRVRSKRVTMAPHYPCGEAPAVAPVPAPVIPSLEEVEARSGVILSEQEKRVVRAVTAGGSIEAAATEAGTTATEAKAIYGAFYAAYSRRPADEQQAFLETGEGVKRRTPAVGQVSLNPWRDKKVLTWCLIIFFVFMTIFILYEFRTQRSKERNTDMAERVIPELTQDISSPPPTPEKNLAEEADAWLKSQRQERQAVAMDGFALIPAGEFTMGDSLDGDTDAPPHLVKMSAFAIKKTEVTKAEWDTVRTWAVGHGYTDLAEGAGRAAEHPVQAVSWRDVVKWCNAQSEREGLVPCYKVSGSVLKTGTATPTVNWTANGYRLPTEAEWEKAARGGLSAKRFPWGDTISHNRANFNNFGGELFQWGTKGYHPTYCTGEENFTSPVGSFAPNGYGLKDMAGNVLEWCWDWYASYPSELQTDPKGQPIGTDRVIRGGSWYYYADNCRVANRSYGIPYDGSQYSVGFRTARSSVP